MTRYKRLVPAHHREMIARHRHPRPNWFIGAAEQPAVPRDPELRREIEELKRELRGEGGEATQPTDADTTRGGTHAPSETRVEEASPRPRR